MTTYKQNVPEKIWVSRAGYRQLLDSKTVDPFPGQKPAWMPETRQYTGNLISALVEASDLQPTGEDEMEFARR